MSIDEKQLQFIFSRKNIKVYFYLLFLIFIGLFSVLFVVTTYVFDSNKSFYYDQLAHAEQYKSKDIRLLCAIISCDFAYIRQHDEWFKYERKEMAITKTTEEEIPRAVLGAITADLDTIVSYNEYIFIKDNNGPTDLIMKLFNSLSVILFIIYTFLFIKFSARRYIEEQYDKGHMTNYIENKLQRNITEVIHHEMGGPVAVIRSEIQSIYKAIYNEKCQYKRSYDLVVKEKIDNISFCLARLDDIMGFMRDAKRIKNSDTEIPIYNLIYSITNTVKCFKIGKLDAIFENEDVLKKFSVNLKTGLFSNIIQVMINNSFEAKATIVHFSAEIVNHNHINLFIKDNGTGIRDHSGKIIKDSNDIYKYGYSTKNANGEIIIKKSFIRFLLGFVGIRINSASGVRGIGLNLNKQVLTAVGGDISVVDTSERGTTFKLYLPVTKIYNKK